MFIICLEDNLYEMSEKKKKKEKKKRNFWIRLLQILLGANKG